ncbi:hypothetical protein C0J52_05145 [Blattella germanica]|nr:hypothetical protein C0J52_05145 [Blattella germanica]
MDLWPQETKCYYTRVSRGKMRHQGVTGTDELTTMQLLCCIYSIDRRQVRMHVNDIDGNWLLIALLYLGNSQQLDYIFEFPSAQSNQNFLTMYRSVNRINIDLFLFKRSLIYTAEQQRLVAVDMTFRTTLQLNQGSCQSVYAFNCPSISICPAVCILHPGCVNLPYLHANGCQQLIV